MIDHSRCALRVPVVQLGACTLRASRRTSPATSTTLPIQRRTTSRRGGSRDRSSSGRRDRRGLGGSSSGSGWWVGRDIGRRVSRGLLSSIPGGGGWPSGTGDGGGGSAIGRGSRNLIGGKVHVDVDGNTRVVVTVRSREPDSRWVSISASGDRDLVASGVELSTATSASSMKSDDFSSDEVVTRCNI
jgi:hypothetical protein